MPKPTGFVEWRNPVQRVMRPRIGGDRAASSGRWQLAYDD
jgi:hypothetical protein